MADKKVEFTLARSEQEIKQLKILLGTRFAYTVIALSDNKEEQIEYLYTMAQYDPATLATYCFGRTDN